VIPIHRGQLGKGTEGLEGEVRGGSSLEGAGKGGGCGVKVAVRG
jgi:hypothetical protein